MCLTDRLHRRVQQPRRSRSDELLRCLVSYSGDLDYQEDKLSFGSCFNYSLYIHYSRCGCSFLLMLGSVPRATPVYGLWVIYGQQHAQESDVLLGLCRAHSHLGCDILPVHLHQSAALQCHELQISKRLQGEIVVN